MYIVGVDVVVVGRGFVIAGLLAESNITPGADIVGLGSL